MGGEIHADPGGIYGSPRVHAVLKREGVHLRRKRVAWETFAHADADLVLSTVEYALAENPWMITRTECIRGRVLGTRTGANLAPFELGLLRLRQKTSSYSADEHVVERGVDTILAIPRDPLEDRPLDLVMTPSIPSPAISRSTVQRPTATPLRRSARVIRRVSSRSTVISRSSRSPASPSVRRTHGRRASLGCRGPGRHERSNGRWSSRT